jgi:succinyl-diaminopimelate desuccinylase
MDYLKVLMDLIAIDTTAPPGDNYGKAVDYLEPLFRGVGFKTERVLIPPEHAEGKSGRVNLLAHRRTPGKPRLIFYAHIDVVPAHGWDAFHPKQENGKVFGRGAADMKGSIPALLIALEKGKPVALKYDVSVMVTTDEEVSQGSQLRYQSRYLQPLKDSYVFDLDSNFGYVSVAGLGALQLEILVKGKSVHSGLSHLGENAVEGSIPLLQALLKLKKRVTRRKSRVSASPETGLEKMVPRLNINVIQGGLKVNIVPDECLISIDRRLIPEEKIEDARSEILETIRSVPELKWEIKSEFVIPTVEPSDNPALDRLAKILKQVTGEGGKYGEMGSGDLKNIVVNEWGGQEFGMGVIRTASNIHGKDEYVNLKDIRDLGEIIYRFLTSE